MLLNKYSYYWSLILLILTSSCRNEACQGKVYKYEDGYCVFLINNKFYTVQKWDEGTFCVFPTDDSIISFETNHVFYRQELFSCDLKYDLIEMANSIELPRHRIGFLYNLRIVDARWEVALYYPSTDENLKGTYSFNITESEDKMFKGIVNIFRKNTKEGYYPIQSSVHNKFYQNPAPALYLKIQSKEEQSEYFGASVPTIYDSITSFYMLDQIVNVILQNHILSQIIH